MISRSALKELINDTESTYLQCWNTVEAIRKPSSRHLDYEDLIGFQPTLGRALYTLDNMYRALSEEKRALIGRKPSVSINWFTHRLALIASYQEVVRDAIAVGKAIGNSFAWFFYHKHRRYLDRHAEHQQIFHTPPGIGGLGEIAFIERFRVFHRHLVIYHATTTFLRLGDVTFVDLRTLEPAAIGELKTRGRNGDKLVIDLLAFGPDKQPPRLLVEHNELQLVGNYDPTMRPEPFPPHIEAKLHRQATEIAESLSPPPADSETSMQADFPVDALRSFTSRMAVSSPVYQKINEGMLLVGVRNRGRGLYSRLTGDIGDLRGTLSEAPRYALEIVKKGSAHNRLFTLSFYGPAPDRGLWPGATPLLWWPVSPDFVRRVLFHEVHVTAVYNPAYLLDRLIEAGYQVNVKQVDDHFSYEVTRELDEKTVALGGFHRFVDLVARQLWPEEAVVELLDGVVDTMRENQVPEGVPVEIRISQHLLV